MEGALLGCIKFYLMMRCALYSIPLHHPVVKNSRNQNIIIVLQIIFYDRRYLILYPGQSILVIHTGKPQVMKRLMITASIGNGINIPPP